VTDVDTNRELAPLATLTRLAESAALLDGPGKAIGRVVRRLIPSGKVKDAISGTWAGHAVHPPLTDMVIGSFTSASVLDLVSGDAGNEASERLIMLGIAFYGPTALTGISDWADAEIDDPRVRRAGLVHANSNAIGLALYVASLLARRRGDQRDGVLLGLAGLSAMSLGGYLGGHLALRLGVGPDQTIFDPGPTDWTPAADASQLPEARPTRVVVDDTPVLLLRDGELIFAIHDRCSHRGCSLSEGTVEGEEVVCPCHGSRFGLRDGSLLGGPATAPQPTFQVRQRDGVVEVRRLSSV
jgi:nitrite reductase/ring-hydroxylating ferredoxin subunit/uncharacterized membrane protein